MIRIKESGMVFEFDEDRIFQIENSNLHSNIGTADIKKAAGYVVSVFVYLNMSHVPCRFCS